ncbi:homeobox-leucine zipper protein ANTHOCYANINLESS 2-like [Punica granatum]|uniref:Homeobox-leucine zipper protein ANTHOCYANINLESS 2-like n=2 Tax=Punica granatum TaxID=22663 RepID=A0A6P8CBR5_PUNGR|nr:homeobox-leucine zipper protein ANTHOCYANINLESS 2-like [Punica granatum]XP_031378956.1 homeobox-leucine zipper protein ANTHOCYANINLESS 2-like [Punica granatum]OWM75634.1 hypothetical protein CDL15_Pgr021799 [Punica granatum]PKI32916.1 hypothetical protein CRG98_046690 [Punica granatum]
MDGLHGAGDNNNFMGLFGGVNNFEADFMAQLKEEGYESHEGSENFDAGSGDEVDVEVELVEGDGQQDQPPKKKKYHRHTPQQIQLLESFFKECPHPDEKQRNELSRRLGLESKQIKFWFQNRRTQLKTQMERHENAMLREDNTRLRNENHAMRTKLNRPICNTCGGPAVLNGSRMTPEEQQLKLENARLKDELTRICVLSNKFLGRPISPFARSIMASAAPPPPPAPSSGLENVGIPVRVAGPSSLGFPDGFSIAPPVDPMTKPIRGAAEGGNEALHEKSMFLELAVCSMNELIKMAEVNTPLWARSFDGAREVLNHEEYMRIFSPHCGSKPRNFVPEGSRETAILLINSLAAVEILMDVDRWAETFLCMIARASIIDVISGGISGNRNGALQLMEAELQVLSPLVPVRRVKFLRFCKQHAEGIWAVADISVDLFPDTIEGFAFANCRRLPSGCILQDMPNGCCKVTWIEHSEYDEGLIPDLYRSFLRSGLGFGAQRWVATLQRQCEFLTMLMPSANPGEEPSGINLSGRRSMLKLAQRMVDNFCSGVCTSMVGDWEMLYAGNIGQDIRVMTRNSLNNPGLPPGILLSASTSVWMPVSHEVLFNFLRDERVRSEWDILSRGGLMQEAVHIAKGQSRENCVSLLRANPVGENATGMLILQETWSDASGSLVVYAPVDVQSINLVMGSEDSSFVALLPSGFVILPDACDPLGTGNVLINGGSICAGSLLTVGFQILVNSVPMAKLNAESVETVNGLIACTVQKIKAALQLA